MLDKVKEFISDNKMISRGDTVWVALSGGADSICLLNVLNKLKDKIGFELKAVHVNHMLRGAEGDRDEAFCREACGRLGIDIAVYYANVRQMAADLGMTIEQAGRKARYDIFDDKCPGKIAIAHNLNDNAETLLMNLVRGTGTAGLSGISCVNGSYIRPLLKTSREDIEKYCLDNKIEYVYDSSNEDTAYFRNAVRHRVIPLLDEITGRDTITVLNRAASSISADNRFIDHEAELAFEKYAVIGENRVVLDNKGIVMLHPALLSRVARKAVEAVRGSLKDIEEKNTQLLLDIIKSNRTGAAVDLPGGITALVQFGSTIISNEKPMGEFEYMLPVPGKITVKELGITLTARLTDAAGKPDPGGDIHYFSQASCTEGLTVRNRRNGDIIKPWKGAGTAKLKKYFIDRKIERSARDRKLLITCGNKVVFIDGMAYGVDYMPKQGNKIIMISIERR